MPVRILAIDDLRLLRMQHQLAGREAVGKCAPQRLRLVGGLAVTNGVIRVALERDVRIGSHHPHIERIVQKQIRQDGADDAPNAKGNFSFERVICDWRTRIAVLALRLKK